MRRIAIVNHFPISGGMSGKELELLNLAKFFKDSSAKVEAFTLSSSNKVVRTKHLIENQISGGESKPSAGSKAMDMASLMLFSRRPNLERMNKNQDFIDALSSFDPDLIISGSFLIAPLLSKYLSSCKGKKPKIIATFDSQKVIYNYLNSLDREGSGRLNKTLVRLSRPVIRSNYLKYNMDIYKLMLDISDAVVLPTEKDRIEVSQAFPRYKSKLSAIPAHFIAGKSRSAVKDKIHTILFVGGYSHWPNKEAITNIKEIIAPALPKKLFLIAGKGTPYGRAGNIEYLGTVPDVEKVIANADLCIAPLASGSGLKVKILDYFKAGKAVIGTNIAFDGYPVKNGVDAIVEDDLSRFAERILELESNPKLFRNIQKNTRDIRKYFSEPKIKERWLKLADSVMRQRK